MPFLQDQVKVPGTRRRKRRAAYGSRESNHHTKLNPTQKPKGGLSFPGAHIVVSMIHQERSTPFCPATQAPQEEGQMGVDQGPPRCLRRAETEADYRTRIGLPRLD